MPQYGQLTFRNLKDVVRKAAGSLPTIPTVDLQPSTQLFRGKSSLDFPPVGVLFNPSDVVLKPHPKAWHQRLTGGGESSGLYLSKAISTVAAELEPVRRNIIGVEARLERKIVSTIVPAVKVTLANFNLNDHDAQDFVRRVNRQPEVGDCLERLRFHRDGLLDAILHPVDHSAGLGLGLSAMDKGCSGALFTSSKVETLGGLWNLNVVVFGEECRPVTSFKVIAMSEYTATEVIPLKLEHGVWARRQHNQ